MPQYRGTPGPKRGSGWVGEWGWVGMGDFWYSIGNVNELNGGIASLYNHSGNQSGGSSENWT